MTAERIVGITMTAALLVILGAMVYLVIALAMVY